MSGEQGRIREATGRDQAFLDAMNIAASMGAIRFEADYPDVAGFLDVRPSLAAFSRGFGRPGDIGLIAQDDDDHPVGAIWGRDYARTGRVGALKDYPFEMMVAVREASRGRGIGQQLLDAFAVTAAAEGVETVSLGVYVRSPARRWFERSGFSPLYDELGREALIHGKNVAMVRELQE